MDEVTDKSHNHQKEDNSVPDSSDDEDDVPLVNLLKRPKNEKPSEQTAGQTLGSEAPQTQHEDDSSDDEPLAEMSKTHSAKKAAENQNKVTSRRSKKTAVLDSSDEDDVPLVNLLKRPKNEKPSEQTAGQTLGSKAPQTQHDGDSSDDEPLSKVAKRCSAKKANQNRSRRVHMCKKTAVLDSSDDDVPLVNLLKRPKDEKPSEKTADQTLLSEAPQTQHDDDSSDDEPLSKFTKSRPAKKTEANQIKLKSSRRTYKRTVSSSDDSDCETHKKTKGPSAHRPSPKSWKPKPQPQRDMPKDTVSLDGSSDDDLPLVNLIRKQDQTTTKTKTTSTPAQRSTSKPPTMANKTHAIAAESSDDEPLINLLKKPLKDATNTSLPQGNGKRPEKRGQTPTNNQQGASGKATVTKKMKRQSACNNGSSSDSSDDEPLVKIAKNPHVTMFLKVMVERCKVKDFGKQL